MYDTTRVAFKVLIAVKGAAFHQKDTTFRQRSLAQVQQNKGAAWRPFLQVHCTFVVCRCAKERKHKAALFLPNVAHEPAVNGRVNGRITTLTFPPF